MKHLIPLIIKEFKQIRRDVSSLILALVLPVLMILLFGYCINLDSAVTRLAAVLEDESPAAHGFIEHLSGSPNFRLARAASQADALQQLHQGQVEGILIIPSDFSRAWSRSREAKVHVVTDGTVPNTASFTSLYMQGAAQKWLQGQGASASISVERLYRYNQPAISRHYILPGAMAVVLSFIGTLLTTMVVAREWERGSMEGLLASPIGKGEFILSKLIPYFLLGLGAMAVCTATATLLFGVPLRASLGLVFSMAALFLLSVLSIGLLVSTIIRNQYTSSLIAMNISILPTILLSGFVFELSSMPGWVQAISYLIPARYFASSLTTLFLAGKESSVLLLNTLFLAASALFWLSLVFLATPKRLDS